MGLPAHRGRRDRAAPAGALGKDFPLHAGHEKILAIVDFGFGPRDFGAQTEIEGQALLEFVSVLRERIGSLSANAAGEISDALQEKDRAAPARKLANPSVKGNGAKTKKPLVAIPCNALMLSWRYPAPNFNSCLPRIQLSEPE